MTKILPRRSPRSVLFVAATVVLLALLLWSTLLPGTTSAKVPRPTVTAVSPNAGPTCWGPIVTITGTNFIGASCVRIGTLNVYHFKVISSTKIKIKMPPQSVGTRDVQVTTRHGGRSLVNKHDRYTYLIRPKVTGLSSHSGSIKGGKRIIIYGSHFTGATSVRFGLVTTSHFSVLSSTKIRVTVPAQAAGTHDVEVSTAGGRSRPNKYDKYTYK